MRWLILVFLLIAPLLGYALGQPMFFDPLFDVTARRVLLVGVSGLLLALLVFTWVRAKHLSWRWHWLDVPVLLFALSLGMSVTYSEFPNISLWGPVWHQDGILLTGSCVLLYIGLKHFLRQPREIALAVVTMVLAGVLVACIGFLDILQHATPGKPLLRLASVMKNSMLAGSYFAMLIPLGVCAAVATPRRMLRWLLLISAGILSLALLLTLSRSAWVGLAVTGLILLLYSGRQIWALVRQAPISVRIGFACAGVILFGACLLTPSVRARLHSMTNLNDPTLRSRLVYMRSAVELFQQRPWHGWGIGTFIYVSPEFRPQADIEEAGISINQVGVGALPHNIVLQTAAEMGWPGVLSFLLIIVTACIVPWHLRHAPSETRWLALGCLGAILANFIVNQLAFDNSATLMNFWVSLALLGALAARTTEGLDWSRSTRPLRGMVSGLVGLTGIGLGLVTMIIVISQSLGANATYRGIQQGFDLARALARKDLAAALQVNQAGIDAFREAIDSSLVPNFVSYRLLSMAYRERMLFADHNNDTRTAAEARDQMFRYGEWGLELMDRDPDTLRFLVIEYLECNRLDDADHLLQKLLVFQPNSAQVRLLYAKYLALKDDIPSSLREAELAVSLDSEYGRAHLWLGRIQMIAVDNILLGKEKARSPEALVLGKDTAGLLFAQKAVGNFKRAMQLRVKLPALDRLKYATALFLLDQPEQAIVEGRQLHGYPELEILTERVNFFYIVREQYEEGQRVIKQLRQPTPKPTSTLSPAPPPAPSPWLIPWQPVIPQ